MVPGTGKYTLDDLGAETGLPGRTIRSWIKAGLLPKPLGRGRGAHFEEDHLTGLRFVQALRRELGSRAPLEVLAEIVRRADPETIERVASGEEPVEMVFLWTDAAHGWAAQSRSLPEDSEERMESDQEDLSRRTSSPAEEEAPPPLDTQQAQYPREREEPDLWTTIEVTADIALRVRGDDPEEVARLARMARMLREWIESAG